MARFVSKDEGNSPAHNQNWIYDDVTQIFIMAPKPRDTI